MYNTDLVKIHTMKSGNLGIETPFNAAFKDELQALIPSANWLSPLWIISPLGEDQANELLAKYYPPQNILEKVRIEWDLDRESPEIDGIGLANVSRDWWRWRKDCAIDFKVIEQSLTSGGSAKYPGLYGKLTVEVMIRPGAEISPRAVVVTIKNGQVSNPLADFSTEELLAEIERRN
ncbi:MAG: hypothetical protein V3W19_14305 [Desulfatiglandales bacterium]